MASGGGRRGTRRVARSMTLSEIDHDRVFIVELGKADVALTFAEAARCPSCTITGLVARNTAQRTLTLRAINQTELVVEAATSTMSTTVKECFIRLPKIPVGSSFVATSTGSQWHVRVMVQRPSGLPDTTDDCLPCEIVGQ